MYGACSFLDPLPEMSSYAVCIEVFGFSYSPQRPSTPSDVTMIPRKIQIAVIKNK